MTTHLISYTSSGLSLLNEITPCFSPLKIYIPWGGAAPENITDKDIIVSFPPEEYKPEADFNVLLDECFNWAYEQGEKSRKEIIKTGHINPTSNESLRHIKTILANRISDASEKETILRWHVLLHLADRLEENRNEANRMLDDLKKQPSPLLNNADLTENTRYPLENLRSIDQDFFLNDTNLKLLMKAWNGLFNSLIDTGDMLLTIDRCIFDYLSEEAEISDSLKDTGTISFKSPLSKNADIKSREKTIGKDIHDIALSGLNQEDKINAIKKLTTEFEEMFRPASGENHILFTMFFFRSSQGAEEKDAFIKFLSDRVIIFAEING